MTGSSYSNNEIKKKILKGLDSLCSKDSFLLENSIHERTISSSLTCYLKKLFPQYDVDHEYDKHGEQYHKLLMGIKECSRRKKSDFVIPDIIIHIRNSDANNLVVIEVKKNKTDRCDIKKLEKFTDPSGIFGYKLGLFIKFIPTNDYDLLWFENGRETNL